MVYFDDFESFERASKKLFLQEPQRVQNVHARELSRSKCFSPEISQTRYCVQYNHQAPKLVLKVTDDRKVAEEFRYHVFPMVLSCSTFFWQCLKFRTDKISAVKQLDNLNRTFFTLMTSKKLDKFSQSEGSKVSYSVYAFLTFFQTKKCSRNSPTTFRCGSDNSLQMI